jgi:hypothetical protein
VTLKVVISFPVMKKTLIFTGIVIVILFGLISYGFIHTKSYSPEAEVNFEAEGLNVHITYCRPYKKGRVIFSPAPGALIPYGKVWRTGANAATTFETSQALKFNGKILNAGIYSLWTIPGEQTWSVIFNTEYRQWGLRKWGVDFNGEANRDPKSDALMVDVPSVIQNKEFEQFTISVEKVGEEMEMILLWDKTLVAVPFNK